MPPITSTDLIQNNKKLCRLMTLDLKKWYVVVELSNPKSVVYNWSILKKLTDQFNQKKNDNQSKSINHFHTHLIKTKGKPFDSLIYKRNPYVSRSIWKRNSK